LFKADLLLCESGGGNSIVNTTVHSLVAVN
jgi:hypothetical protein